MSANASPLEVAVDPSVCPQRVWGDARQLRDLDHLRPDFARALVEALSRLGRENVTRLPLVQKLLKQGRGRRPEGTNGLSGLRIVEFEEALVQLDLVDLESCDFIAPAACERPQPRDRDGP